MKHIHKYEIESLHKGYFFSEGNMQFFKTKKEALEHIKYTIDRFNNSSPWECFVKIA